MRQFSFPIISPTFWRRKARASEEEFASAYERRLTAHSSGEYIVLRTFSAQELAAAGSICAR